jgi:single-stranded-DNA-specific exonuclease
LDMVGIATVADMVPLMGENRVFASFGLTVLRKSPRPGIHALCRQNRVDQRTLTEQDIGFTIGPRINAASRMDTPELAFELLSTITIATAESLASELEKLNRKRKGVVASMVKEARIKVTDRFPHTSVALVGDPSWKPALLGLAANSVLSGRKGMVCLWGRDASGVIKGSCRSDGTVNVVSVFQATPVLLEAGGHACAGGFSISHEHIHTLPELFQEVAQGVPGEGAAPVPHVFDIPLGEVDGYHKALEQFAPFGVGNERPLVRVASTVLQVKTFGKEAVHTELKLADGNKVVRAFEFFKTPLDFTKEPHDGVECAVVGSLVIDGYGMRKEVGIRIHDIQ